MVYAIAILTSPLHRVNSTLQRGTNISKSETTTKWYVFPGTVTYTYMYDAHNLGICAIVLCNRRADYLNSCMRKRERSSAKVLCLSSTCCAETVKLPRATKKNMLWRRAIKWGEWKVMNEDMPQPPGCCR